MTNLGNTVDLTDAAFRLKVSYHTAYRFVLTGEMKAERIYGKWHVDVESLEKLVKLRDPARKGRTRKTPRRQRKSPA